jgi:Outer membrane protein beta-barrel domain
MKNIFFKLTLFLLMPVALMAQGVYPNSDVKLGIKLGVNFANLIGANSTSSKSIVGVNSGLVINFRINNTISFQPEICYMGNGSTLSLNNDVTYGSAKFNINYLQLPILMDYKLNRFIHLQAGPYVSYLLSANIENSLPLQSFDFKNNIHYSDFNKVDLGFIGGASFHIQDVSIGCRYNIGFLKVADDKTISGNQYHFANGINSVASIYMALTP